MALPTLPTHEEMMAEERATESIQLGPCSLYLQGSTIYLDGPEQKILYEITSPPCEAAKAIYTIQKAIYKVSNTKTTSRLRDVYSVRDPDYLQNPRNPVLIEGRSGNQRSHKEATMSTDSKDWASCTIEGYFNAVSAGARRVSWRYVTGHEVAAETLPQRGEDNKIQSLPRLTVYGTLSERDFDLLVAGWVARLWKETQKLSQGWKQGIMGGFGVSKSSGRKKNDGYEKRGPSSWAILEVAWWTATIAHILS